MVLLSTWKIWGGGGGLVSENILFYSIFKSLCFFFLLQDLYCVRSDLGNLLKALGRLEEAKVRVFVSSMLKMWVLFSLL